MGSIKADCEQWKDVIEGGTVKEFNKLHSHINKIRGGLTYEKRENYL